MKRSLTITGLLVSLIGFVFQQIGVEVNQSDLESFVAVLIQLGGIAIAWYARVKAGGVSVLGKRKTNNKKNE